MAIKDTFLELSPEHGGLRFGPFSGMEIRLGSLPAPHNDITLPEELGILPEHVKVIAQGDGSFVVAPIERSAGVFIWRSGGSSKQIFAPIAIQSSDDVHSADAFSLGSVEGPKFFILCIEQEKPKDQGNDAFSRAKKRLTGKSILTEIKRQGVTAVITTKGGAFFQYYWTFVRTGTIFQPRYLIMFFLIGCGWLTTGIVGIFSCNMKMGSIKQEAKLATADEKLEDCQGGVKEDQRSFRTEVARTLSRTEGGIEGGQKIKWTKSLPTGDAFSEQVKAQFRTIFNNPGEYRRYYLRKDGGLPIKTLRDEFKALGMPTEAARVMSFLAARDQDTLTRDWRVGQDSAGERECFRGPLRLSWRQSVNLNLNDDIHPIDAMVSADEWDTVSSDSSRACLAVTKSLGKLHDSGTDVKSYRADCPQQRKFPSQDSADPTNDSNQYCLFTLEADARSVATWDDNGVIILDAKSANWKPLATKINAVFNNGRFPNYMSRHDLISRLMYFFMADAPSRTLFARVDKAMKSATAERDPPVAYMKAIDGLEATVPWATKKAARIVALAAAIPCLAVKDARKDEGSKNLKKFAKNLGMIEEEMPTYIDCIVTDAMSKDK